MSDVPKIITGINQRIGLKPQQSQAVDVIADFLESKTNYLFVLSGYAGTGKTYSIKYLLRYVIRGTVCCTAPTHKAARNIEHATGKASKTLQSLLGLRPNMDLANFDIANPQFDPKGTERLKEYSVVIIDECSQINNSLFTLLANRAFALKTKVIFMGDKCQLPPIGERESVVFRLPNQFELTEVIRQGVNHPLMLPFDMLRHDIIHNTTSFIKSLKTTISSINEKNEGYQIMDRLPFAGELIKYMSNENFHKNLHYARYTAWTNDNIQTTNTFIRNKIIPDNVAAVHEDDLLTGYTTLVDENLAPIITNSDDYIIHAIIDYVDDFKMKTFGVNLINVNTNIQTRTLKIIDHCDAKTLDIYSKLLAHYHYDAIMATREKRTSKWLKYYEFKQQHLCLIDIPVGRTYAKKDLDYGYGLTTYKIQGSTINNMFINIANMIYYKGDKNKPIRDSSTNPYAIEFMNKNIYTALSRTKNLATLLYY